jgi:PadR family transcriptional regulator PadR
MMDNGDFIKGSMGFILLSTLLDGDKYGYEITKTVHSLTAGRVQLKEGSLYPALHKLEKKGHVEGYWAETEPGRPGRKYYRITEEGRKAAAAEQENWKLYMDVLGRFIYGNT